MPLGLDSLATTELTLALEEAFGVRVQDDVRFRTLEDARTAVTTAGSGGRLPSLRPGIGRLQRFSELVAGSPLSTYYRLRVEGAHHVPTTGAAVIAMNHDSLLDIPFLVIAAPRPVWFMAKVELFSSGFGRWAFDALGGFPVRRGGGDLRALRAALEVVRRGRLLGMYPEGTRAQHLQPFLAGAAWVALATGAPLAPVGIAGTAESMPKGSLVPRRTDVRVRFGSAIPVAREDEPRARLRRARELTQDLRSEVERLLQP